MFKGDPIKATMKSLIELIAKHVPLVGHRVADVDQKQSLVD